jgi:hypothetical protein
MFKPVFALIAFSIAMWASSKLANSTIGSNRGVEWKENEKAGELSNQQIHWTVVHIRDDIGGIHNLLTVANGLLAAILVALLV